jgi:hypothetical protein
MSQIRQVTIKGTRQGDKVAAGPVPRRKKIMESLKEATG